MSRAKQSPQPRKGDYEETFAYYAQFLEAQMRSFARFVILRGYGASAPNNIGTEAEPIYETWQQVGRRLYGPAFVQIFRDELDKRNAASRKSA